MEATPSTNRAHWSPITHRRYRRRPFGGRSGVATTIGVIIVGLVANDGVGRAHERGGGSKLGGGQPSMGPVGLRSYGGGRSVAGTRCGRRAMKRASRKRVRWSTQLGAGYAVVSWSGDAAALIDVT
jgi:hypothetical protein